MFDTLIDLGDSFGDWLSEGMNSLGILFGESPEQPSGPDMPPIETPELPAYEAIAPEQLSGPTGESSIFESFKEVFKTKDPEQIQSFSANLTDKDKTDLMRALLAAGGSGAAAALQNLQQQNRQDFQREQDDRGYAERRGVEDRAREERARMASGPRISVSSKPRGIVANRMG